LVGAIAAVVSPPFPAFVIALMLTGVGACINNTSISTYTAHFKEGLMLSILYAAMGVRIAFSMKHER
jgi:hypothetical protein